MGTLRAFPNTFNVLPDNNLITLVVETGPFTQPAGAPKYKILIEVQTFTQIISQQHTYHFVPHSNIPGHHRDIVVDNGFHIKAWNIEGKVSFA